MSDRDLFDAVARETGEDAQEIAGVASSSLDSRSRDGPV
jgi:hypothetical protein